MSTILLTHVKSNVRKTTELDSRNLFIDIKQELNRLKIGVFSQGKNQETFLTEIVDN